MQAMQWFLTVALCTLFWITTILDLGFAEEITIYDKDWRVKERIQGGTIYDWDWKVKGHIEDGRVYDRNWNLEKRIEGDKIYDWDWNLKGRFDKSRAYYNDRDWNIK